MQSVPPFHIPGQDTGDFFALAFVPGRYVGSSTGRSSPAFFMLCISTSEGHAPFNTMSIAMSDHECLSYHRGSDVLDTVEFAVLYASQLEGISPDAWRLYPLSELADAVFPNETARDAYWTARRRLCLLLHVMRGSPGEPLFRSEGEFPSQQMNAPDSAEILRTVFEWGGAPDAEELVRAIIKGGPTDSTNIDRGKPPGNVV